MKTLAPALAAMLLLTTPALANPPGGVPTTGVDGAHGPGLPSACALQIAPLPDTTLTYCGHKKASASALAAADYWAERVEAVTGLDLTRTDRPCGLKLPLGNQAYTVGTRQHAAVGTALLRRLGAPVLPASCRQLRGQTIAFGNARLNTAPDGTPARELGALGKAALALAYPAE